MIVGIGIDTVEIKRFMTWLQFNDSQLQRIFSQEEIIYCRSSLPLQPQRFAARFAAREAFFKAWVSAYPTHYLPFLTICKALRVISGDHQQPIITIDWESLDMQGPPCSPLISITHTRHEASVIVLLQKITP